MATALRVRRVGNRGRYGPNLLPPGRAGSPRCAAGGVSGKTPAKVPSLPSLLTQPARCPSGSRRQRRQRREFSELFCREPSGAVCEGRVESRFGSPPPLRDSQEDLPPRVPARIPSGFPLHASNRRKLFVRFSISCLASSRASRQSGLSFSFCTQKKFSENV